MAVTHADVWASPKSSELGSKRGALVMVVSVLLGLFCFILCLIAEAARSQVQSADDSARLCTYTGSGKAALVSATAAFAALAAAMLLHHLFLLLALTRSHHLDSASASGWDPDHSPFANTTLTCQAALFFVATWVSFAVGEIQLLIAVSVESGHLNNWGTPRHTCLVLPQGLFTAAGVLALATVFFASGLYITALRAHRYLETQLNARRHILDLSIIYASPPTSPPPLLPTPLHHHHHHHLPPFSHYLQTFDKPSTTTI